MKTILTVLIGAIVVGGVVFAISSTKIKTIPIDIRSSYSYKCITSDPATGITDRNKPKLPIDKKSFAEIQDLGDGGGKDKNSVYFCFGTKKLRKANPKTFQTIILNDTGSYQAPFIFKDDKQVYIKTEENYMRTNGTSYGIIKTYPKLDASNFSCFFKDRVDGGRAGNGSLNYCKNNKNIYIISTSHSYGHTSSITTSKLYSTNLDSSLLNIDPTTNQITYNSKPFETITNQFWETSDTGERIPHSNPLNIQESTYTINFK